MNAGLTPEFSQLVFRLGESMTFGLVPILSSYIIYLAYIQKYNQESESISMIKSFRYQFPYAILSGLLFILLIIMWYLISLPIGINGFIFF